MFDSEFFKWAVTQGGLTIALIVVSLGYRRDFMRKLEDKDRSLAEEREGRAVAEKQAKEDRERFEKIIEQNTAAITNAAVAMARQTDATHRLARVAEKLDQGENGNADRRSSHR